MVMQSSIIITLIVLWIILSIWLNKKRRRVVRDLNEETNKILQRTSLVQKQMDITVESVFKKIESQKQLRNKQKVGTLIHKGELIPISQKIVYTKQSVDVYWNIQDNYLLTLEGPMTFFAIGEDIDVTDLQAALKHKKLDYITKKPGKAEGIEYLDKVIPIDRGRTIGIE